MSQTDKTSNEQTSSYFGQSVCKPMVDNIKTDQLNEWEIEDTKQNEEKKSMFNVYKNSKERNCEIIENKSFSDHLQLSKKSQSEFSTPLRDSMFKMVNSPELKPHMNTPDNDYIEEAKNM